MKWQGGRRSSNVDDRRSMSGGKMVLGGGVIGVVVLLVSLFTGTDLTQILNQMPVQEQGRQAVELSEA
ncbi:MAG TPA: neutral zinc metallopeptidase, partial [Sphingobacteriaceae bacterium]|nr:neutral zinc metallopeptidase [Sphingobacteriaceae bacterium]